MKYSRDLERERKIENMREKNIKPTEKKSFATVERWKIYCF